MLDGGLSTELEARGHDVGSALWSARLLRDDPGGDRGRARRLRRGRRAGGDDGELPGHRRGVRGRRAWTPARGGRPDRHGRWPLAREGQGGDGWVAGSVGPYGAMLADGSEYTGAYVAELDVAELRAFHRPRMELLAEAGADVLACETVPAAAEAEALVAEAGGPRRSRVAVADHGGRRRRACVRTRRGERAAEVFALARGVDAVIAVGVNCTDPAAVGAVGARPRPSRREAGRRLPEQRRGLGRRPAAGGPGAPGIVADDVPAGCAPAPGWSAAAAGSGRSRSQRSPPSCSTDPFRGSACRR